MDDARQMPCTSQLTLATNSSLPWSCAQHVSVVTANILRSCTVYKTSASMSLWPELAVICKVYLVLGTDALQHWLELV